MAFSAEHLTPLEKSVLALGEGLQHIQAEQEYMKMRERIHRNSESPSMPLQCLMLRALTFITMHHAHVRGRACL